MVRSGLRRGLLSFAWLAAILLAGVRPATTGSAPPNVVVMLADDLGWGDLALHGGTIPTPHLDRLFRTGIELETVCVMPLCSPTRAGLLTGRHPARVGVNPGVINARIGQRMNPDEVTLAEVLRPAGYRTAALGKWHLGYAPSSPNLQGFDLFYGFLGAATSYLTRTEDEHTRWMLNDRPQPDPGYTTDLIRDRAIRWVRENRTHPFFLYVAFNAVHNPVEATEAYLARVPATVADPHARARAAMLIALDDAVGAILRAIEEEGLARRTIVLFLSDNGPTPDGSAGPLRGRKGSIWEGGVRSPAAIRWDGALPGGHKVRALIGVEDFFPTLLRLVGVPPPAGVTLDGRDFSAALRGGGSARSEYYWVWRDCDVIRTERYKLVRFANRRELYDLQHDPGETRNVAAERPDVVRALERRLDAWEASVPVYPTHVPVREARPQPPQPAGDVLEVRVRRGEGAALLAVEIGEAAPIQLNSGDRAEFDLMLPAGVATAGIRLDVGRPDAPNRRRIARGEVVDDEAPAPGGNVERAPVGRWTHRTIGLANHGGRLAGSLWLVFEGNGPAEYRLYLDNLRIRRADGSAVVLYRDGPPPVRRLRPTPGDTEIAVRAVPLAEVPR